MVQCSAALPKQAIKMCLLATAMLDRDVWEDCRAIVDADSFYQADHQIIWRVVADLYAVGDVDAILVREALIKRGLYEAVGGRKYMARILGTVPSPMHGPHYASIVAEKA